MSSIQHKCIIICVLYIESEGLKWTSDQPIGWFVGRLVADADMLRTTVHG